MFSSATHYGIKLQTLENRWKQKSGAVVSLPANINTRPHKNNPIKGLRAGYVIAVKPVAESKSNLYITRMRVDRIYLQRSIHFCEKGK